MEAFNAGDGSLNLSVSSSVPWLAASVGPQRTCTTRAGVCLPVQIALQTASLARGMHTGVVTVRDPNAVDAPQTITVTVQVGGGVPDRVDLYVAPNGGADRVTFYTNSSVTAQVTTQSGGPWLLFSLDGAGTFRFPILYRIEGRHLSGMAEGSYEGAVLISNSSFAPDNKRVPVRLHVTSQPIAQVVPARLRFRLAQGAPKAVEFLWVANRGLGTLAVSSVTVSQPSGQNWLSVDSVSGLYRVTAEARGLTPGVYQGAVVVASNAANGPQTVPVELEVVASGPPWAYFGGVVNNATFAAGETLSQGDICAVFGEQFSFEEPQEGKQLPLVQQLGKARVLVNGQPAPLYYASYGQINFQIPYETPPGEALVRVERDGQVGNAVAIQVAERASRILRFAAGGWDYGIVVNQDGSFPIPAALAAQLGVPGRPAREGDALVIYAIGMGRTSPPASTGAAAPSAPLAWVAPQPKVVFGGDTPFATQVTTDPFFAGLTPGFVGLYQINVFVPPGAPKGDAVALRVERDGDVSNIVRIAIE
ncbi:MAG: hypothetical protein NZM33_05730 [Bryobacteraceae bacterium]|nr:hypothetical protein [Bryobacteraceae bacterium]